VSLLELSVIFGYYGMVQPDFSVAVRVIGYYGMLQPDFSVAVRIIGHIRLLWYGATGLQCRMYGYISIVVILLYVSHGFIGFQCRFWAVSV
jgi:hypothetical protein